MVVFWLLDKFTYPWSSDSYAEKDNQSYENQTYPMK